MAKMNKQRIDKNKILDLFYQYLTESNDDHIMVYKVSKTETMPAVYYGIHHAEYRIIANEKFNRLDIYSYFTNKDNNFQTHIIGSKTASLLNIPRAIYEMIEDRLTDNGYIE